MDFVIMNARIFLRFKLFQFFEVIFVTAPHATDGYDALIVVDVDPQSSSYQQAIVLFKKETMQRV